jgi:ankyrin repeat protein
VIFQNKLGDTPLHSAAWKGHAEAVELLLERGIYMYIYNYLMFDIKTICYELHKFEDGNVTH